MKHIRLPAAAAVVAQLAILIASPVVTGVIGPKWTAVLMVAQTAIALAQAQQKPVKREKPTHPVNRIL